MKRFLFAAALAALLPWSAGAQVEKQVEVTKAYVPALGSATKLAVEPDMTDTTRMRPEIDYAITPLSLQTTLQTRPIRPAQVTYWEFNRPKTFYVKAGAGYPFNTVFDFYASTQNPGTGYVVGYVNHEGRYADIRNDFGVKNNSVRMLNRIGAAAGKYVGRRVLEGEFSYENRAYHRYGAFYRVAEGAESEARPVVAPGALVDYGAADVAVRLGDDFKDLSRLNFDVSIRGGLFFDHSARTGSGDRARQTTVGASARIARGFGRHRFSLGVGYDLYSGRKSVLGFWTELVRAGARYGIDGGLIRLEAGADYYYNRVSGTQGIKSHSYVIPFARLDFNLGTRGLKPFLEVDGGVYENSYRSLTQQNPYVENPAVVDKSSVDYNGRFGIGGSLWRGKMNYRVYGAFSIHDHHVYWLGNRTVSCDAAGTPAMEEECGCFTPVLARQTVTSINGEVEYRPVTTLKMMLGVHGYLYNDDVKYGNGAPSFEGNFGIRYDGRKVAFGVGVLLQSERKWSVLVRDGEEHRTVSAAVPFGADLRVDFGWRVSDAVTLFAEGRNLANRPLYAIAGYREYGANFTVGVKANF